MPSAMTTVFGATMPWRRAARFGVAPTTLRSWTSPEPTMSPTTTNPVATPMGTCKRLLDVQLANRLDRCQPRPDRAPHRPHGRAEIEHPSPIYLATNPSNRATVSATHL